MFYLTLAALACVLVVSRLTGLDQSLWHDEVFGVVNYVRPGPSGFWLGEYEPNDHLLFNLLAWLTTSVTGLDGVALRAWSVLPGIVAVAALTWWSWERLGPWVAVVVAFLATTSPLYLLLHKEARGYGLMALASVLLLISADRLLTNQGKSLRRWFGFGGAGVLGITTHLAFALGFAAQAAALFVRRRLRAGVLVVAVCVGLASAATLR